MLHVLPAQTASKAELQDLSEYSFSSSTSVAVPFPKACRGHGHCREDRQGRRAWLTWSGGRGLPGVGHVEGRLLDQRRGVHAPPDEEAGSAAEKHAHHQEEPGESTA